MARLQEYKTYNSQFCKRLHDFLSIMFTAQVGAFRNFPFSAKVCSKVVQIQLLLGKTNGLDRSKDRSRPVVIPHDDIEVYLGRYSGLMLYLKEMDEQIYNKLCSVRSQSSRVLFATLMHHSRLISPAPMNCTRHKSRNCCHSIFRLSRNQLKMTKIKVRFKCLLR